MLPIPFLTTLGESIPIAPYTAMRMEVSGDVPSRTGGCCVYPIIVQREALEGKEIEDYVFDIEVGVDSGQFGWLRWKGAEQMCQGEDPNPNSANILGSSLAYPGNSCACDGDCWKGYQNPDDSDDDEVCHDQDDDQAINVGDWVWGSTGAIGAESVKKQLDEHIEYGRTLLIIVWDDKVKCDEGKGPDECSSGSNLQYKVYGFALVRLLDYSTGDKTISAIFLGWVDYCGQNPESLGPAVTSPV